MIYFIQAQESKRVKIGYTASTPEQRLSQCQTGNPELLVLLFTIEGDETKEQELHRTFSAYHVRGEWFDCKDELKKFVEQNRITSEEDLPVRSEDFFEANPNYKRVFDALFPLHSSRAMYLVLQQADENDDYFPQGFKTPRQWKEELDEAVQELKDVLQAVAVPESKSLHPQPRWTVRG